MEDNRSIRILVLSPTPPANGDEGPRPEPGRPGLLPSTRVERMWCAGAPTSYEHDVDRRRGAPLVLDKTRWAEKQGYDAVVVSCMRDPGVAEARRAVKIPVVGLGEANRAIAHLVGSCPATFFGRNLRVKELGDDPEKTYAELIASGRWYVRNAGADVLIPNCSLLNSLAPRLQSELGVPVLPNEDVGLRLAETLVALGIRREEEGVERSRAPRAWRWLLWIAARARKRLLFALPRGRGVGA